MAESFGSRYRHQVVALPCSAGWAVMADGCPSDTDGDGVVDGEDDCPKTPRGAKVDSKGCPSDSDGDGVVDGVDQCAKTAAGAKVDSKGCPSDSDGDGVADGIDRCADTPRGASVDANGCPSDGDKDGVWNGIDKCAGTPAGTKVDATGCPEKKLFDPATKTLVLEGVKFETNSAILTSGSTTILDRVVASLKEWPSIDVEVAGHTDSVGAAEFNRGLSQRRAEAVKSYLVGKGISASKLTAKGHGEDKPAADNGTKAGRAENRRVELKRLN